MQKIIDLQTIKEGDLLSTRICDLPISIKGHRYIENRIHRLNIELKNRGIIFQPHIWISDDWFSPDGSPGFAIPFYLFHPKLIKLERKFIGFAEGTTEKTFLQLIRHETGHAIDNAFGLRRIKRRQNLLGVTKTKYPEYYHPDVQSADYVFHLNDHYAQSHPDEDWAETFAVWLTPRSNWRKIYKGTKAYEKLTLVEDIITDHCTLSAPNKHKIKIDHFKSMRITIREYLTKKQKIYLENRNLAFLRHLKIYFRAIQKLRQNLQLAFLMKIENL